ncbi:Uncharacterized protein Adt_18528 [Abeliophyllum distichum]|uniref:Uncharacterized protein n=1 Tax=Abeliophyllum distichum TaxID=126358 RepID=A0ABD1TK45_9LAMI
MATNRSKRDRQPSSSSEEEAPQANRINHCPVFIRKNVDLASFTFDASLFHIEDLFVGMGWVSILTLNDKFYPSIIKEFYMKMVFSPRTGISCLVRNKRIKITLELIHFIIHLEDGGIRLYTTKTIHHLEEYNPVEACRRVTKKHFEAPVQLSTNQLTLTCRVLHNIIFHNIVPRKGHLDESKGFDDELRPSTFPFEDGEEMDEDEDDPLPRPRSHRPSSSTLGFTEDHFNLLIGGIDSLTSSVEGLHHMVEDLHHTMDTLQQSVDGMTSLLQALHSRLDAVLPPHLSPEN